jgi:hypothetical protein
MFNASDFRATCLAIIAKLPPGVQAETELGKLMWDYIEQTDLICSSEHSRRGRIRMLERSQQELVEKLEALCDTEQPDAAEELPTSPPAQASAERTTRRRKRRRDSHKPSAD